MVLNILSGFFFMTFFFMTPLHSASTPSVLSNAAQTISNNRQSYLTLLNSLLFVSQSIPHVWRTIKPTCNTLWDVLWSIYTKYKRIQKSDVQLFIEGHVHLTRVTQNALINLCHNFTHEVEHKNKTLKDDIVAQLYRHTIHENKDSFEWAFPDYTFQLIPGRQNASYYNTHKQELDAGAEIVFLNAIRPHLSYGMTRDRYSQLATTLRNERSEGRITIHHLKNDDAYPANRTMVSFGRINATHHDHDEDAYVFEPSVRIIMTPRPIKSHEENLTREYAPPISAPCPSRDSPNAVGDLERKASS